MALKKLDREISAKFFHNKSSVAENLSGVLTKKVSRISARELDNSIDIDQGVIKLDKKIDPELVRQLNKEKEKVLKNSDQVKAKEENGQVIVKSILSSNVDFKEKLPTALEILDQIDEEIKEYYGSYYRPEYFNIIRYPALEQDLSEENTTTKGWHYDRFSPDHIRLFVLLTDVEKDSGGSSKFLSKEDSLENIHKEPPYTGENFDRKYSANEFYGEKGTTGLADPVNHLHRGTSPEEGKRDMLMVTLRPSPKPLPDNWKEELDYSGDFREATGISSLFKIKNDLTKG